MSVENIVKIILKSGKDRSILRFHPWIFSGAIKKIIGNPSEGDLVRVYSNQDDFLGIGHYQIGTIAIRVFLFSEQVPDKNYWSDKFKSAIELRNKIGLLNSKHTNVFRLIHGEGDGFPGFICDYYNKNLVFQFHSIGMYQNRMLFAEIIQELLPENVMSIYDKSEKTLPHKADIQPVNGFLFGNITETEVLEYDNKFIINTTEGQKTGFFIDQRENRKLLEFYSNNANVLNMFCYTGGFSVSALKANAASVTSVDSSAKAIELTDKNVTINFGQTNKHESLAVDAFEYLDKMPENQFDVIILDPPAFAKHFNVLNQAIKGYTRINKKAFEKIKSGGILFTFSCSQVVSKENFARAIADAAAQAKREVKILHQLNQPPDHPVNLFHPEGEYLKGLVVYVN